MRGQLKGNSDARSRADCHTCILRSFERHRNLLGKDRTRPADNARECSLWNVCIRIISLRPDVEGWGFLAFMLESDDSRIDICTAYCCAPEIRDSNGNLSALWIRYQSCVDDYLGQPEHSESRRSDLHGASFGPTAVAMRAPAPRDHRMPSPRWVPLQCLHPCLTSKTRQKKKTYFHFPGIRKSTDKLSTLWIRYQSCMNH